MTSLAREKAYHSVNSHVKDFPRSHDAEETVNALEDGNHHLVFILRCRFILRMSARMDNAIHIQVEIVEFHPIGIRQRGVHRNELAVHVGWLVDEEEF